MNFEQTQFTEAESRRSVIKSMETRTEEQGAR